MPSSACKKKLAGQVGAFPLRLYVAHAFSTTGPWPASRAAKGRAPSRYLHITRRSSSSIVFFFLMIRRPPSFPLFPYTTLFRSDIVFARLCGFVPMYALGLAQPMMGKTVDVVPLLTLLVAMLWGFFIHANLRWRFGWLGLLIATPAFHHWHHTNDEHVDKNYASMLPIMDALFGSWYMPKKQWPTKYGIDGTMAPGLAGEVVQPFLPEAKAKMPTAAIHSTVAAAANRAS